MPHDRLDATMSGEVSALRQSGTAKGSEAVIVGIEPEHDGHGPRYLLEGDERRFIRMNSNSYLGLSRHPAVVEAEERATKVFGAGSVASHFISFSGVA